MENSEFNKVLYHLSVHSCSIMDGWHPYSSKLLAEVCEMPLKETLKELRKLKAQGLITSFCEAFYNDYTQHYQVYWGWTITSKAETTEEYQKAYEREREICKEVFNIDIGSYEQKKESERELEKWEIENGYRTVTSSK